MKPCWLWTFNTNSSVRIKILLKKKNPLTCFLPGSPLDVRTPRIGSVECWACASAVPAAALGVFTDQFCNQDRWLICGPYFHKIACVFPSVRLGKGFWGSVSSAERWNTSVSVSGLKTWSSGPRFLIWTMRGWARWALRFCTWLRPALRTRGGRPVQSHTGHAERTWCSRGEGVSMGRGKVVLESQWHQWLS